MKQSITMVCNSNNIDTIIVSITFLVLFKTEQKATSVIKYKHDICCLFIGGYTTITYQ